MHAFDCLTLPWIAPELPDSIAHGDMPGDKIQIAPDHIEKAQKAFQALRPMIAATLEASGRCVVAVCGGSGVGKSEIASILAYYLQETGIGAYILSGDNYPRRIPYDNDRERQRVFRMGGLRGLLAGNLYNAENQKRLSALWAAERDADPSACRQLPFLSVYQRAGRCRLGEYLGSREEIDFDEVSRILAQFKQGAPALFLKRMGRSVEEVWYDSVDFSGTSVLILEWTHSNSDHLQGVDLPILLNSTPSETMAHRRSRNRDQKTDSPFTTMVLELEQKQLEAQAEKAKLILSKSGEILSYAAYRALMAQEESKHE